MKKKVRLSMIVFLGMFLLLAGIIVQAQATIHYSNIIDEYGPGYYRDNTSQDTSWHVWSGALRNDPTIAGIQSLIYIGAVNPDPFSGYRDVLVLEDGSPSPTEDPEHPENVVVSDVIRFYVNPNPSGMDGAVNRTWVIFYSDRLDGVVSLADLNGLPDIVNMTGWVWENPNGSFYFRTGGDPQGNFTSEFYGYSEGHATVPEPSTMLLLGSGLLGLAGLRRKFRK